MTDMIKAKDGDFFITDWLRNRNTLEYIGIWEKIYNPAFNYGEFATIKSQSGLNNFKISVKELVESTNAISVQAMMSLYRQLINILKKYLMIMNWMKDQLLRNT